MKRIPLLWIAIVLLTGCATASPPPTPTLPPTAEITNTLPEPTDHTEMITVKAGETFDLVVPSNPSTGYHWDIVPELDGNLIAFVAQDYTAGEPVMPGSGGVDVWTFRALNAGDTTIVLGYFPPGNETDPEESVTFSIHVE
ncbi:MAG TPA: protease inhibitor I42 family protein [Anaerolineales bacterium]|nr:protease inhibitor I42 family protein [Anaerolineales bacterium]